MEKTVGIEEAPTNVKTGTAGGVVPTLLKEREEWGTRFRGRGEEIESLGHPSIISRGKEFTDWSFQNFSHPRVTGLATGNSVLGISHSLSIRKRDDSIVQVVLPKNPIRQDMLVVERNSIGTCAANEAALPLHDVRNKAPSTEEDDSAVGSDDTTIVG